LTLPDRLNFEVTSPSMGHCQDKRLGTGGGAGFDTGFSLYTARAGVFATRGVAAPFEDRFAGFAVDASLNR